MTTNNDLNQQRAVSSNNGANIMKSPNQNQPTSPNNAHRNGGGTGVASPVNNVGAGGKDPKN